MEGVPKFKKVGHEILTTPPFDPKMLLFVDLDILPTKFGASRLIA